MNLKIAKMWKQYENFHIFHFQKKYIPRNAEIIYGYRVSKKPDNLEKLMRRDNLFKKINQQLEPCLHFVILL